MNDNIAIFDGDADQYDTFRIAPPAIIVETLTRILGNRPHRVVDLGCGTGLSTTIWIGEADEIIGIEPNSDMRTRASRAFSDQPTAGIRDGTNARTGLDDESVDIVTCSQSLHWMDPDDTHPEILRILRPGGILAAFSYAMPPTVDPVLEKAFLDVLHTANRLIRERGLYTDVKAWPIIQHLEHMKQSGCYGYTKEVRVHQEVRGTAIDFFGLIRNYGSIDRALKAGITEPELAIPKLQEVADDRLGQDPKAWLFEYRVIVGTK